MNALYDPSDVRDQCGFGLVAHQQGQASHRLLQVALESLTCMTHRGGIAADGRTGDGCGLSLNLPTDFFFQQLNALGVTPSEQLKATPAKLAVGMFFLHPDKTQQEAAKERIQELIEQHGLISLVWREVPINAQVCGPIAQQSLPTIMQLLIDGSACLSVEELNRKLYCVRRYAETSITDDDYFYVASLSASVVVYKALVMPEDLPRFYLDLNDESLATSIVVFHQRFSTNTLPKWPLAQPFRYLAHNGEINTIRGNRQWSIARTPKFQTELLPGLGTVGSLVNQEGSDSSALDNMLDVLLNGGMDLFKATRILLPPAWQNVDHMDAKARAFYEYNSMHMEPWDGPAGIVLTDGRYAMCMLDRNGLRPARWVLTKDDFITVASEIGTFGYQPEDVVAKGRVGPGQVLVVDTQAGELLHTKDIEDRLKQQHPYRAWLKQHAFRIQAKFVDETEAVDPMSAAELNVFQKFFMVSQEERRQVLMPMAEMGQEATGSMGDDTPTAVLSRQIRPLADYCRQQFAQVTNPPIDPLREAIVMSLESCLGKERNVFDESPERARRVILKSPILSRSKFLQITQLDDAHYQSESIDLYFDPAKKDLRTAITKLCDRVEAAVRSGKVILVLSDRHLEKGQLPIPALLATGAVHHRLVATGLRCDSNIIVQTACARDAHQCATLIGVGATAVYPYLAYQIVDDLVRQNEVALSQVEALRQYRKAISKGLLKILSKMGISSIASYRGAQLFELVGLGREVSEQCFDGAVSRIDGMNYDDIQSEQQTLSDFAWSSRKMVSAGGLIKYVHGGEYHAFNPDVVVSLQQAVNTGDASAYQDYVAAVEDRGVAYLRDLLAVSESKQTLPIEQVEAIDQLTSRFDSAGMSLGALSPEAHETLAMAMNQLGARSNSGEGGEDPARFNTIKNSKIKQIASGRFGVTPAYLMSAEVLQIKIAQGAKPGEGGQLPGGKVNALIARLRYSVPGVTLISPPPHHDIYSIEDLAQLIYDLKQINPKALVSVKLVSAPGIGTIAAGVVKAYADLITVSGYDGGTAASPLTSIRYAGSPWELGLSEVQQTLRANGLRGKVRLQVDGGIKTGLDVIKAAILGAESFGFGTTPMVAMGCKYLRICHLNNCATGVATQQVQLRSDHFHGDVEKVTRFFQFIAEDTRHWLARLGFDSLEAIIGQTQLLKVVEGVTPKQNRLDLSGLLAQPAVTAEEPYFCQQARNDPYDQGALAQRIATDVLPAIESGQGGRFDYPIQNCDRSVGAHLSGVIAAQHGNLGMESNPVELHYKGTAGQSFAVWNAGGLHQFVEGDANDYVAKGMAGGKVVLFPPKQSRFESQKTAIIGNTCLYGATGGKLFAAGRAGERFAIRNSGATAVVEGAGDHCCEYMTGGVVVVLGPTGYNFGAGMTGGVAYVLDTDKVFMDRYNRELIDITRIRKEAMEAYQHHLEEIIREYVQDTQSQWGRSLLEEFDDHVRDFWLIKPKAASLDGLLQQSVARPE